VDTADPPADGNERAACSPTALPPSQPSRRSSSQRSSDCCSALKGFPDLLAFDRDGMSEIARDGIENGRIQKFEYCAGASAKRLRSGSTSASSPISPDELPVIDVHSL